MTTFASLAQSPIAKVASATILATASFWFGYFLGSWTPSSYHVHPPANDDWEASDGDLSAIQGIGPCKLVLIVRTDINMTPGVISAQCGRATLTCYKALMKHNPKLVDHWEETGQAKIALRVASEEKILELEAVARSLNLCARSIKDRSQADDAEATTMVLGIGPAPVTLVNEVSGALRLL